MALPSLRKDSVLLEPEAGKGDVRPSEIERNEPSPIAEVELDAQPAKSSSSVSAFVDGKRVAAFYVLLRHPGFLITEEYGTHEITRMYVNVDGRVRCSDRLDGRIGPAIVERVEFSRTSGLTVTTSRGVIWSPPGDCQATWL